jgi:hypothetical protein
MQVAMLVINRPTASNLGGARYVRVVVRESADGLDRGETVETLSRELDAGGRT